MHANYIGITTTLIKSFSSVCPFNTNVIALNILIYEIYESHEKPIIPSTLKLKNCLSKITFMATSYV